MTPYYHRDGITILHEDCRDVLPDIDPATVDGSCLTHRDWRDVDVRLPVPDSQYEWRYLTDEEGAAMWTLDCVSVGALLRAATGLPIDFQPQSWSTFRAHEGPRQPLMPIAAYAGGPTALHRPSAPEADR